MDFYGHCYHCMLQGVSKRLLELQDGVDYIISTCNLCVGIEERRLECKQCNSLGYMVDKKEVKLTTND